MLEDAPLTLRGTGVDSLGRVEFAGDVDGDGLDDLVLTTFWNSRVWVVPGGTRGDVLLDDVAVVLSGEDEDDEAGMWLTTGLDADQDGLADLVVGAPEADIAVGALSAGDGGGQAYVFGADSRGVVPREDARVELAASEGVYGFGWTLGVLGDATGDGWDGLAVQSGSYTCNLFLFDDLSGTEAIPLEDAVSMGLGSDGCYDYRGVRPLGDLDGDGRGDLAARRNYDRYYTSPLIVLPRAEGLETGSIPVDTWEHDHLGLSAAPRGGARRLTDATAIRAVSHHHVDAPDREAQPQRSSALGGGRTDGSSWAVSAPESPSAVSPLPESVAPESPSPVCCVPVSPVSSPSSQQVTTAGEAWPAASSCRSSKQSVGSVARSRNCLASKARLCSS